MRRLTGCVLAALAACVSGCAPDYSPNTYASSAVQQANKAEPGVVVGVRRVDVSASGAIGAATGAAAGGIAGSQTPGGVGSAFGALGGALVGGLVGSAAEHATGDTQAIEYIVRKTNGELLSVTQKDAVPLAIGLKVLVIAGTQARIVADYTVAPDAIAAMDAKATPKLTEAPVQAAATIGTAPFPAAVTASPLAAPRPPRDPVDASGGSAVTAVPPPLAAPVPPEVVHPLAPQ